MAGNVAACVCAGVVETTCYAPFEHIKTQLQTQYGRSGMLPPIPSASAGPEQRARRCARVVFSLARVVQPRADASLWSTLRHVYRQSGIRGAYTGYVAQLLRECPGNVVYFGSYTASRTHLPAGLNDTYGSRALAAAAHTRRTHVRYSARQPFFTRAQTTIAAGRRHLRGVLLVSNLSARRRQVAHASPNGSSAFPPTRPFLKPA